MPPRGRTTQSSDHADLPRGLHQYIAFVQLESTAGKETVPVRAGRPLIFAQHGTSLFSLVLLTHYSPLTGATRVTVKLTNFAVPAPEARRTTIRAAVTLGYVS